MRFGLADSSDDSDQDDLVSLASFISDESDDEPGPSAPRQPRSTLGKNIITYLDDTSDDDLGQNSDEDDVQLIGGEPVRHEAVDLSTWRDPVLLNDARPFFIRTESSRRQTIPPLKAYETASAGDVAVVAHQSSREYEEWLKDNEEDAWLNGLRIARERRGELRQISKNTRIEMREKQGMQAAKEAEDLRKMLEGMTIKHDKEQEEVKKRFDERSKKLWENINAAILAAERREAEKQGIVLEADRKRQEAEAARLQAEKDKQDAAARQANEAAERERRAREKLEDEKARAEEAARAAEKVRQDETGKSSMEKEWAGWVEKQKWMKGEVIERVKASKETRTRLKVGMRVMTRSFGQMVNSRSKILQVTEDMHQILCGELPSPPSAASPVIFSPEAPVPYLYLLSHVAKALIKQATNEIAAKPDTAFPLAKVVLGLQLRGHAALGDVFVARIVKKCPWAIPHYPVRRPGIDREEYEKSTGRGSDESVADYISRMMGILTLLLSIQQTSLSALVPTLPARPTPDQLVTLINPALRLPSSWTWLSNMLKQPVVASEPATALVTAWTKVAAPEVIRLYGKAQVGKIMRALLEDGVQSGQLGTDTESRRQAFAIRLQKYDSWRVPEGRDWE